MCVCERERERESCVEAKGSAVGTKGTEKGRATVQVRKTKYGLLLFLACTHNNSSL